uniref:Uncharacterized protein n=1 Tax=Sphaerodactylus townsendi TaxID=933632 RepID=A0ACB8EXW8_9SAUR
MQKKKGVLRERQVIPNGLAPPIISSLIYSWTFPSWKHNLSPDWEGDMSHLGCSLDTVCVDGHGGGGKRLLRPEPHQFAFSSLNTLFPLQRGHHGVGEGKNGRGTSSPKPYLERGASFNTFCTTELLLNTPLSGLAVQCKAQSRDGAGVRDPISLE